MSAEPDTTPEVRRGFGTGSGFLEQEPRIVKGDWLYAMWGYEQTNASFWLVTRRTAKTVWFKRYRQIGVRDETGRHLGAIPNVEHPDIQHVTKLCDWEGVWRDHPRGMPCDVHVEYKRKVQEPDGNGKETVWVTRPYMLAVKWDGVPKYDTIAAGLPGH